MLQCPFYTANSFQILYVRTTLFQHADTMCGHKTCVEIFLSTNGDSCDDIATRVGRNSVIPTAADRSSTADAAAGRAVAGPADRDPVYMSRKIRKFRTDKFDT